MSLLTAAALLGAAGISSAASMYNNRKSIQYAEEANEESIALANTAHQREIRDLAEAGLNPILSATSSGAATPQLKTPNLESIDGNITNSASGIARALNGLTDAEIESAKADAHTAKAYANNADAVADAERLQQQSLANMSAAESSAWLPNAWSNLVDSSARLEAISGRRSDDVERLVSGKEGWKTYNDLVQKYRNEIETGRYNSSIQKQVIKDVVSGANSAGQIYREVKGRKAGKVRR